MSLPVPAAGVPGPWTRQDFVRSLLPVPPTTWHDHRRWPAHPPPRSSLRDLARLRRVRDRIDREYAQPLDVEALARGAHMSAGHLSREFRLAYGESPYGYLMTRRIERAMALLRRGDLSVTEVCFEVGCSSLGTFSTRFTRTGRRAAQRLPARGGACDGGDAAVRGETSDQTDQESRSAGRRAAPSLTTMDITIHSIFSRSPHDDPDGVARLLSRHARLRGPQRRRLRRDALDHGRPRRPAWHVDRPVPAGRRPRHHRRRAPHHPGDDGQGHLRHARRWPAPISTAASIGCRLADAEIVQEPTDQPYGIRDCAVRDPAGNLIRINQLS